MAASFMVAGIVAISGGCVTAPDDPFGNGEVPSAIDETAAENAMAVVESTLDFVDLALREGAGHDAIDEAVQRLSRNQAFSSVELSTDVTTIILQEHNGDVTYLGTAPADQVGPPDDAADLFAPRARMRREPMASRVTPHPSKGGVLQQREYATPGSRKAALLSPLRGGFDPGVESMLRDAGYEVEQLVGKDVTLEATIKILEGNYGFVAIAAHGGVGLDGRTFFALREEFQADNATYQSLPADVRAGIVPYVDRRRLALGNITCRRTGRCGDFSIDSRVIEHYAYPNTIVWLGGCASLQENDMARAFLDNGAGAFFGYKQNVVSWLEIAVFKRFMEEFKQRGTTARGAYIATRYDKDLFFHRPTYWYIRESSVEDLAYRVRDDHALLLFDAAPPIDELSAMYDMRRDRMTSENGPIQFLPRQRINLQISDDGTLDGSVHELDSEGEPGPGRPITEGLLEGVNLYICYQDEEGYDICMSGRAIPHIDTTTDPATVSATFAAIQGGSSWFKTDLSPLFGSPGRMDSGTWWATNRRDPDSE